MKLKLRIEQLAYWFWYGIVKGVPNRSFMVYTTSGNAIKLTGIKSFQTKQQNNMFTGYKITQVEWAVIRVFDFLPQNIEAIVEL